MACMRWLTSIGLAFMVMAAPSGVFGADLKAASDGPASQCGNHGTTVEFLDTPSEAARKALKEEKLVFVLHVSGNFEDPRFT